MAGLIVHSGDTSRHVFGEMAGASCCAELAQKEAVPAPWQEVSKMDARLEFVRLAGLEGANRRELRRRFGIHPDTGYKWLRRWSVEAPELADRSRRPPSSLMRTGEAVEAAIVAIRDAHPA
jgi:hypothetical protein